MKQLRAHRSQKGFTLLETMVAMVVLAFGILSLASVFAQGSSINNTSVIRYIAQQKAQEAMESIFTARDTGVLSWNEIQNVSQGGVFLDGPQPLLASGPDGIVGTADDDATNPNTIVTGPGPDMVLGTADDTTINLNPWMTRTIQIQDTPNLTKLRQVTITINYLFQGKPGQYQVICYISSYS